MPGLALDTDQLAKNMIATLTQTSAQIITAVRVELQGIAHRIVLIVTARAAGELTKAEARSHFETIKFHAIATIAMVTVLIEAAASKIINAALGAIRSAVNGAIGFALIS